MSQASFGKPRRRRFRRPTTKIFDFATAEAMLPLVRRVVESFCESTAELSRLKRAKAQTSAVTLEFAKKRHLQICDELMELGVTILPTGVAMVGFPTIVNSGLAYFVYRIEDEDIKYWRYRAQDHLRPVPSHWRNLFKKRRQATEPVAEEPQPAATSEAPAGLTWTFESRQTPSPAGRGHDGAKAEASNQPPGPRLWDEPSRC